MKRSAQKIQVIRDLAPFFPALRIARIIGVSDRTVSAWAKAEGIRLLSRDEIQQVIIADRLNRGALNASVPVPKWVPHDLQAEYREYGGLYGEVAAASYVRRMLAEMRAAA